MVIKDIYSIDAAVVDAGNSEINNIKNNLQLIINPSSKVWENIETNFKSVAESVSIAKEAAKISIGAVGAATAASIESAKMAEEARQAGEKAAETAIKAAHKVTDESERLYRIINEIIGGYNILLKRIDILEDRLCYIERAVREIDGRK